MPVLETGPLLAVNPGLRPPSVRSSATMATPLPSITTHQAAVIAGLVRRGSLQHSAPLIQEIGLPEREIKRASRTRSREYHRCKQGKAPSRLVLTGRVRLAAAWFYRITIRLKQVCASWLPRPSGTGVVGLPPHSAGPKREPLCTGALRDAVCHLRAISESRALGAPALGSNQFWCCFTAPEAYLTVSPHWRPRRDTDRAIDTQPDPLGLDVVPKRRRASRRRGNKARLAIRNRRNALQSILRWHGIGYPPSGRLIDQVPDQEVLDRVNCSAQLLPGETAAEYLHRAGIPGDAFSYIPRQLASTLPDEGRAHGPNARSGVDFDRQIDEVQKQIDLRSIDLKRLTARVHATYRVTGYPAAESRLPWRLIPLNVAKGLHRKKGANPNPGFCVEVEHKVSIPDPRRPPCATATPSPLKEQSAELRSGFPSLCPLTLPPSCSTTATPAPSTVWDPPTTEKDDPGLGQRLEAIARRIISRNKARPASSCSSGRGSLEDLPAAEVVPSKARRQALTPADTRRNLFGRAADSPPSSVGVANTDEGCCLDEGITHATHCSTPTPGHTRERFREPE
ncbi:hypothetical protein QAD02_001086 [Eretmocerus hayati]|uniref:Uncharacterized protein n=1 Tax=Eretmocerus hayati TaxID=131215 RepID=A0ACC2NF91_9HYME|nr:hypothetical protein QAD02_001086 [Eretmocerus hayati]